ncbi:MAG TPA: DUF84 family protein [Patescibacteria group bacterium]
MQTEWILGSESQRKIDTATRVIAQVSGQAGFTVKGCAAESGVGNTPYDEDTPRGAQNRASDSKRHFPQADYWIGLESGIVTRYGKTFEETWAVVLTKDEKAFFGFSSGLVVPNVVLKRMQETDQDHWQVMPQLRAEHGIENDKDTWGVYSGYTILREISLEEALRNALVQIFAPKQAFYHL